MEITCDSKRLTEGCKIAGQIKPFPSLPITSHLKITAADNRCILKASNLQQMILYDLKGRIKEQGSCFLPTKRTNRFAQYAKDALQIMANSKDTAELSVLNDGTGNRAKSKFYGLDFGEDFPFTDTSEAPIVLPQDIRQHMSYALQCISTDPARPVLTGMCFAYSENTLKMASADGFRLITVDTPLTHDKPFRIIIPCQAISIVSKYMVGAIRFGFNENRAWFVNDELTIITELIHGTYPAYESLIPTAKPQWKITCSSPILHQRLNQMPDEKPNIIRLTPDEHLVKLAMRLEEYQECEAFIPATMDGKGKIALQRNYLLDASKIFSEITIEVTAPSSPIKVYGDLDGVLLTIMPMFVSWD